ncbi:Xaa-Pro dipeptidase [Anaerosolibacter carboniphilus]|uniref:Xaa-Pro dipeptidase n=1 Tax=Anaerosolibacter carboniphilus TaxID=1417629 RepID=A0A841KL96_9FIRM|nr:M24 family metallopeptidase [Anaerosolibacter carboniphilus]MBB6214136.1 Xaa-Pro dipeptidase [Anaerosolibacter carboniphilus]
MNKTLYFEVQEYKERLRKTKEAMQEKGIDILIATDPANMNYITGFDGWSFYVHQCLVIMADRDEPIWVGRGQDSNAARLTTWLQEESIRPYTDDYVQSLIKHPMDFVSDIIKEKGYQDRVIATEMDTYYYTAKCQERLALGLPKAKFIDGTNLINWVRIIKSDAEVDYIRRAARIAEKAMEAAYGSIDAGVRQCDAAANVYHAQISGTKEFGGDYSAIVPLMPSGIRTSTPHLSWTDEPYRNGDTVILELSGCYRRYHCPLARTMIIGDAPQKVRDLASVVVEGISNALEAVKPGITCEEVERVWARSIAKSGFIKDSRIGYSMGLNFPPDWGEHTASFRPGDKTILQPNMTFHMIPGIWLEDCGVDISESFRVTESGCETFTNYPRKLLVK